MNTVAMEQNNRIHPFKFNLWIAIGSMVMMFAGLTSAYIVKRNQAGWQDYQLPPEFLYSTVAIIISSLTMVLAKRAFKGRMMARYRMLIFATLSLGIVFVVLQVLGFTHLYRMGLTHNSTVSVSFLYVIVGFHALHVAGGIVALLVLALRSRSKKERNYSSISVELAGIYWHFVDLLWIYLLVFMFMIR